MASSCFPTMQKFVKNVAEICKSCDENNLRFKPHIHNLCVCVCGHPVCYPERDSNLSSITSRSISSCSIIEVIPEEVVHQLPGLVQAIKKFLRHLWWDDTFILILRIVGQFFLAFRI
jgi:hypothetical protein